MRVIEIAGHVNEAGKLEFIQPPNLPPGDVRIIIQAIDTDAEAADDALWDEKFAKSQDVLRRMALQAIQEDEAGLTEDFDPDNDRDAV